MKTTFLTVTAAQNKPLALRTLTRGMKADGAASFVVDCGVLSVLPNGSFAYWAGERVLDLFRTLPPLAEAGLVAKQGLATADDPRFARLHWEVRSTLVGQRWVLYIKGGPLRSFYSDFPIVVNWYRGGGEIRSNLSSTGAVRSNIGMLAVTERDYFFRPGLTWSVRARRFYPRALPTGAIFSNTGYYAGMGDAPIGWRWGALSGSIFDHLFKLCLERYGYPKFLNGILPQLPCPETAEHLVERLSGLPRIGWSLQRSLDTVVEVSHAFVVPALLQVDGVGFGARVLGWAGRVAGVEAELERVQFEIDDLCFELYGISDEDRRAITEGFGVTDTDDEAADDSDEDESDAGVELDPVGLAAGLVAWAVGVAVGRFDVRLAIGERDWPAEPDPFDPLPVCSPGMLTGDDGLPVVALPDGYPLGPSPVLVDDPGHELDITARVRAVFDVVFGDQADSWWSEVGAVLDARNGVEGWLRRGFFDHHLKTYSKSRRKAPLMWPIGTKSGSYQVWLYAHSVTPDSLFRLLGDVIEPKLAAEQRQLSDLTQEFGPSPTASQRRTLDVQQRLVDEITELRDEIRAIAALWHPDLNDGIVIVLAPLWRLFAQHRAWAKELKDRWVKLSKGDYDWAQLAMHIWPERVIPKCATDRSLAIAHNLEDVFWAQDDTNPDKWHPRTTPTTPIDQLTADRTNPTTTTTRNHPNP